ncbi:MAG: glutamate racemase [Thermodesulfovibrionales bacterium]|nr:glutamate racemase [Thermodesulfovibrionales bacterium]
MNHKDNDRYLPIGIFDSGVGGLTVLKEIHALMPNEGIMYLGDTARVPYGTRSEETIKRYSAECASFLFKKGIKLLVIACNTASAISLDYIKELIPVPVIGVIEPGALTAVRLTNNKRVGVIGTEATIRSLAYKKAIHSFDESVSVFSKACPLFVPLVEEGWTSGDVAEKVVSIYLSDLLKSNIDCLVLGCTHYPLLKGVIQDVVGKDVRLVDSAIETAKAVKHVLEDTNLVNRVNSINTIRYFVTDSKERFVSVGERFLNEEINDIEVVSLNKYGRKDEN